MKSLSLLAWAGLVVSAPSFAAYTCTTTIQKDTGVTDGSSPRYVTVKAVTIAVQGPDESRTFGGENTIFQETPDSSFALVGTVYTGKETSFANLSLYRRSQKNEFGVFTKTELLTNIRIDGENSSPLIQLSQGAPGPFYTLTSCRFGS